VARLPPCLSSFSNSCHQCFVKYTLNRGNSNRGCRGSWGTTNAATTFESTGNSQLVLPGVVVPRAPASGCISLCLRGIGDVDWLSENLLVSRSTSLLSLFELKKMIHIAPHRTGDSSAAPRTNSDLQWVVVRCVHLLFCRNLETHFITQVAAALTATMSLWDQHLQLNTIQTIPLTKHNCKLAIIGDLLGGPPGPKPDDWPHHRIGSDAIPSPCITPSIESAISTHTIPAQHLTSNPPFSTCSPLYPSRLPTYSPLQTTCCMVMHTIPLDGRSKQVIACDRKARPGALKCLDSRPRQGPILCACHS
jgi:hypothetical protein